MAYPNGPNILSNFSETASSKIINKCKNICCKVLILMLLTDVDYEDQNSSG